ncbi:MAG: glycosyltransferase family 39 protein, partial [Ktedonobacteraceae bacterium]
MKKVVSWRVLALFGLAVLGLALRLYGLNWDQGNNFHPDERQILFRIMTLAWPNSVTQFFDPVNSPLNPHFFAYGSFPLYLLASLGNILSHFSPNLATLTGLTLLGRILSAIFDSGTILLTGWLGLLLAGGKRGGRYQGWAVALLAAALVTFTPLQLQLSHFYVVDTLLLFFVTLTVLACVALVETDAPIRWSLVAGIGYGLAVATKFSAAPLIVPILVAVAMRWYKHELYSALITLLLASSSAWLTFLIAMPYALL